MGTRIVKACFHSRVRVGRTAGSENEPSKGPSNRAAAPHRRTTAPPLLTKGKQMPENQRPRVWGNVILKSDTLIKLNARLFGCRVATALRTTILNFEFDDRIRFTVRDVLTDILEQFEDRGIIEEPFMNCTQWTVSHRTWRDIYPGRFQRFAARIFDRIVGLHKTRGCPTELPWWSGWFPAVFVYQDDESGWRVKGPNSTLNFHCTFTQNGEPQILRFVLTRDRGTSHLYMA